MSQNERLPTGEIVGVYWSKKIAIVDWFSMDNFVPTDKRRRNEDGEIANR